MDMGADATGAGIFSNRAPHSAYLEPPAAKYRKVTLMKSSFRT
jgi:hypothetical protein